jgi:ParB family transcriptional regulator, chromosome partitioning protein
MAGKRVNLSELATTPPSAAGVPVLGDGDRTGGRMRAVPPGVVAVNPLNPPSRVQDLSDLESMKDSQLQACVVVTRAAFTAIYPEHAAAVAAAEFVVVAGSRRRAAAERFGLATLDIVVRDDLASTRERFDATSTRENIDRKDFAPLEEAEAVARLIRETGSVVRAAQLLNRSEPWVSQRAGLLRLIPGLQDMLRSGVLSLREARRLAPLPVPEQEAALERLCRGTDVPVPVRSRPVRITASGSPSDFVGRMFEVLPREFVAAIVAEAAARLTEPPAGNGNQSA